MDVTSMLGGVRDTIGGQRVFGEPYERDGVTIITVARIRGGGGGGDDGTVREGREHPAGGGGFGVDARPVGAYVIRDGKARFEPALDLNRVMIGGQLLAAFALLVVRSIWKRRSVE